MREIKFRASDGQHMRDWDEIAGLGAGDLSNGFYDAVMQYTGLKDKKGAEIYEGDILMFETNVKGVGKQKHYWKVFFSEKGQWCAQRGETVSRLFEKAANHKVAGNIYDHPSLLTNEK